MAGAPRTWRQLLLAHVLSAGDGAAAAGESAAALWRLPGFPRGPIVVRNPYGDSRRRLDRGRVQSCHLPPDHLSVVEFITVTNVPRTVFDLMALVNPGRAERALDNALAMGLTDVAALEAMLEELGKRGRPGTALMRLLLAERGEGYVATESELERLFVGACRRHGVPEPRRQVTLIAGRVDFLLSPRLIIELDGRRNHTALLDREADARRDAKLVAQGMRVMRVTYRRLKLDEADVMGDVKAALRAAA
jgi:very-short-patch-repair endonuclease